MYVCMYVCMYVRTYVFRGIGTEKERKRNINVRDIDQYRLGMDPATQACATTWN